MANDASWMMYLYNEKDERNKKDIKSPIIPSLTVKAIDMTVPNKGNKCEICYKKYYSSVSDHNLEHMVEIIPHLYLGASWNAHNMMELVHFKIDIIINVAYEVINRFHDAFTYKKFMWDDKCDQNILGDMDKIADLINDAIENKQNVLVHCYMGRSRSASAIIGFFIKHRHMTYDDAYKLVKLKKDIGPNTGFVNQLKTYYNLSNRIA